MQPCAIFPEDRCPPLSDTPAVQVRMDQLRLSPPRIRMPTLM
ncbi:MAG: hypothetical protein O3B24_08180 [Verrucomicrobia bacterium]|nr:hypothetical protein [Verrucomicrobiota bacterium]